MFSGRQSSQDVKPPRLDAVVRISLNFVAVKASTHTMDKSYIYI